MSTLAELRDRVEQILSDTTNTVWSTNAIDEGIRLALGEYSLVMPAKLDEVLTLAADGREIDVLGVDGLLKVTEVWWPYDSAAEIWPPNRVLGWYQFKSSSGEVLFLNQFEGNEPQTGDEVRIWYTYRQTIEDLDSATESTFPEIHDSLLVMGAAALAVQARSLDQLRITEVDPDIIAKMDKWANDRLKEFRASLEILRGQEARSGSSWGPGWAVDKWNET
jgi:hypothetical protein